jgi:transcriptional pleiotropic regulator of transition state genes
VHDDPRQALHSLPVPAAVRTAVPRSRKKRKKSNSILTNGESFAIIGKNDEKGERCPMKSTGILKSVDELGRIVLPKKMREALDIDIRDQVEIFVEGDRIILKKYAQTCVFCNSDRDIQLFREKRICRACLNALKEQA